MTKIINCYQAPSKRADKGKRLNLRLFNIGIFALLLGFGAFYLVTVSDLAVRGFALQELKSQVNVLASEKLDYEEQVNNLQSYYSLNSRTQKLNMVAIGEIDYLKVTPAVVARK